MKRVSVSRFFEAPPGSLFYIPHYAGHGTMEKFSPLFVKGETFPRRNGDVDARERHIVEDYRCTYRPFGPEEVTGNVLLLDCSIYLDPQTTAAATKCAPEPIHGSPYTVFLMLEAKEVNALAEVLLRSPVVREAHVPATASSSPNDDSIHPGEFLKKAIMDRLGIGAVELAHRLGVHSEIVENIVSGAVPMTPWFAIRLAKLFDEPASFWIGLQKQFDLKQAEASARAGEVTKGIVPWPRNENGQLVPRQKS